MIEKEFPAEDSALSEATAFLDDELDKLECLPKVIMQLDIVLEELFVNISHYAYPNTKGNVRIAIAPENDQVMIRFIDTGTPFNPLQKEDPDIMSSAEDRDIGGLGIFLTKKTVDNIFYEYSEGQNILCITKKIR